MKITALRIFRGYFLLTGESGRAEGGRGEDRGADEERESEHGGGDQPGEGFHAAGRQQRQQDERVRDHQNKKHHDVSENKLINFRELHYD